MFEVVSIAKFAPYSPSLSIDGDVNVVETRRGQRSFVYHRSRHTKGTSVRCPFTFLLLACSQSDTLRPSRRQHQV